MRTLRLISPSEDLNHTRQVPFAMLDHIPIGSEDKNLDSIFVGSGEYYSTYQNDHGQRGDYLSYYLTRGRSKKAEAFSVWSQGMELEPVGGNDRETDLYPL